MAAFVLNPLLVNMLNGNGHASGRGESNVEGLQSVPGLFDRVLAYHFHVEALAISGGPPRPPLGLRVPAR